MYINYELIDDILNIIFPIPKEFGITVDVDKESVPINYDKLTKLIAEVDSSASIDYGTSKLVIFSPKFGGVVIKIPFNGYFLDDGEWLDFEFAPGSDCADYCNAEWEKYNELKALKLDCFVAKTYYYKTIDGTKVFLQDCAIPYGDAYLDNVPSKNSLELAKAWHKTRKFHGLNSDWIANCVDKYSKAKTEKFLNYCNNCDNDILADAHEANFGYRLNGTPCIFDFSNFSD